VAEAFPGERVFSGAAPIRYLLHPATQRPDTLVVAFAGAHQPGEAAHYHWHRVLAGLPCHRMFLLDDHGCPSPEPGPSWYLGAKGSGVAGAVHALIQRTAAELGVEPERTLTAGTSMGGWAALYFGARVGAGHVIAGEPQTRLGDYLCGPAFHPIAEHVAGGSSRRERRRLDGLLFDAVRAAPAPPHVHVCCGRESSHYERHVLPLLALLTELGAQSELELGDYSDHEGIASHFPVFLRRCLDEVLGLARDP
jgi:pimeloyl-ACP methyl ester carboxylesterase